MAPVTPPLSPRYPPIPSADPAWSPDPARRDRDPHDPTFDVEDTARAANAPADFFCPVSLELMRDPVTIPSTGQTFERRAIESWLSRGGRLCPTTGLPLDPAETFVPNDALRAAVLAWALEECPAVVDPETAAIRESPEARDARLALERADANAAAKRARHLATDRSPRASSIPIVEGNPTSPVPSRDEGDRDGEGDARVFSEGDARVFIPANRAVTPTSTNGRVARSDRPPRYVLPWTFIAFAVVAFAYNVARVNRLTLAPLAENPLLGGSKRNMIGDRDAVDPNDRRPPYAHCGASWRVDRGGGDAMVFTSPFAHGSLVNVLTTTFALAVAGPSACGDVGEFAFATTYLLSSFVGVAASMFAFADRVTCAGHAGVAGILGVLFAREMVMRRGGGASFLPSRGVRAPTFVVLATVVVLASLAPYHDLVAPFAACIVGFLLAFLFYKPEFGASLGWRYRSERRAHVAARALLLVAILVPFALAAGMKRADASHEGATRRSESLEMMRCVPEMVSPWSCDVDLLCGGAGGLADRVACADGESFGEASEDEKSEDVGASGNDEEDERDRREGSARNPGRRTRDDHRRDPEKEEDEPRVLRGYASRAF